MISESTPSFVEGQEVEIVDWMGVKFDSGRIISAYGDLKALFGNTLYRVWQYKVSTEKGIILDLPEHLLRQTGAQSR